MCGLNIDYQLTQGGLGEMHARSLARAAPIYECIDKSNGFYVNNVEAQYRSRINITFRIRCNPSLEAKFVQEGAEAGLLGLKAPQCPWVCNGARITLNNSMPFEGVYAVIDFMNAFRARNI